MDLKKRLLKQKGITQLFFSLCFMMLSINTSWGQTAQALPFSYTGGHSGLIAANGWSTNLSTGAADNGDVLAKIIFNTAAKYTTIYLASNPGTLTYYTKVGATWAGLFEVLESPDNGTYTTVRQFASYADFGSVTTAKQFTDNLKSTTRYVKWVYTTKTTGNINFGTIAVSAASVPTYYYKGSGSLSNVSNWGVNSDGTGANPTNLTDANTIYVIKNGSAVTDALWTLGTGSKVVVGDATSAPVTLTVASGSAISGTIDVTAASSGSNSVLWQDATASPTFGTLDNSSEVHLQPATAATYNFGSTAYGKLFIDGAGQVSVFASSLTSTIKTSFFVAAGSFIDFPVQAITYMYVNPGASVTINGSVKTAKIMGLFSTVSSVQTANSYGNFQLNTTATLNLGSVSTIEYTKANSDQIISALPTGVSYNNLTISETGATNTTTKTIPSPITVNGTLTINLAGINYSSTTVGAANITLGDGATIVRMAGALNAAPTFGTSVNVTYNGANALTSGVEIPTSSSVLNNLTINKSGGVTLGTSTTVVNGTLALTAGTLDFGANTLILKGNITGTGSTSGTGGTIEFDGSAVQTNAATLSASTFTINAGKQLTNNGTISATNFTVASSSAGTATFKNSGTLTVSGTSKVQQYLTNQSWYLTSPVWDGVDIQNSVTPTNLSRIQGYNEGFGSGNDWSVSGTTMKPYKGYITTVSDNPKTVEFTGKINSGDISIPLTRQGAGNENKYGFNLIGNPYTAYLDWKLVSAGNTAKMPTTTMWYRTKVSGSWAFSTVNGAGEKSPADVSDLIPPMQAFWVRASGVGNTTLDLTTTMIAHDNASTNKMKAPAAQTIERTKVRLQVSNTTNNDELLIYTDAQASNSFDMYDSPKMSNNSADIPEISTIAGSENLVINGLNSLVLDTEMPIRFMTKTANSFSLKSNELSNLPEGIKVILKDNGTEFDLTNGAEYNFTSDVADNANRFSLLFRSPGVSTDLENNKLIKQAQVFVNAANQITIIAPEKSNYDIYNATGQLIENGVINTKHETRNTKLKAGVYLVKVANELTKVIIK